MRKRKVFRETVITVIVIALCGKLWFVICKAMVSPLESTYKKCLREE